MPPASVDVSVITTTYNGLPLLTEAVQSVLMQEGVRFEYIVIDDGSTDATPEVMARFGDPRLHYVRHERIGRAVALNLAIEKASGRYVANLDADDLMLPGRLARQQSFLDATPEVGMLGSACYLRQPDGSERLVTYPTVDAKIRQQLVQRYPFTHSAVMYRRDGLVACGGYDRSFASSEDYDLCVRLAALTQLANLDTPLAIRRIHGRNYFMSHVSLAGYVRASTRIKWRYWQSVGCPLGALPRLAVSVLRAAAIKAVRG